MSRNGSGTYTLPAGNPVVTGTTISSTWANNTLTDIATALTGSLSADGQTTATGALQMGSNKITGLAIGTVPTDAVALSQLNDPNITGNVDIAGTLTVHGETTFANNTDIKLPVGTTAQRPIPLQGMIRFNTTLSQYEGASNITGVTIASITHVTTVATLTTSTNHNLVTGNYVTISGATPAEYNGTYAITVTGNTTFTYTMATSPATNATVVGTYYSTIWSQIGGATAFSVYLGTTQTVSTGVFTKLALNTKTFDTANAFDATTNYRFTPQVAGYYQFNGEIYGIASTSMIALYSAIYKNGTLYQYGGLQNITVGTSGQSQTINTLIYLNGTTDYIELYGLITGSGTCTFLSSGATLNWFNGVLVR